VNIVLEEVRIQYEEAKRKAEELYPKGDVPNDIAIKMEEIAYNLPLSREYRPQWDREILEKNGMKIIKIQENIGELVWDEEEKTRYAATPMFMVCAGL